MKDKFNREIDYLRVSLTDLCNLRCIYCMPKEGVNKKCHEDIISFERIIEIVEAAVSLGIKKVRLTGGEPLVRKGITNICRDISSIKGIEELTLTTNGILLAKYAKELKNAGVNRINISLDTLRKDRFFAITRGGNLDDVIDGINEAKRVGFCKIKLNCVLVKGFNDDEVIDLINFAKNNDLELRFIELMRIGEATKLDSSSFLSNDYILRTVPGLIFKGDDGVSKEYGFLDSPIKIGLISPLSYNFCSSCCRLRLTSDGKLKPCLHSSLEIDLKDLHGETLTKKIKEAILAKPLKHHLDENKNSDSKRGMSQIGG